MYDEDRIGEVEVDHLGNPMERVIVDGQAVIVHYVDIPDKDLTVVRGIPCTTALRTVIDIAPDSADEELDRIVAECFERELFTVAEANERLAEADMQDHPGAELLRAALDRWGHDDW